MQGMVDERGRGPYIADGKIRCEQRVCSANAEAARCQQRPSSDFVNDGHGNDGPNDGTLRASQTVV